MPTDRVRQFGLAARATVCRQHGDGGLAICGDYGNLRADGHPCRNRLAAGRNWCGKCERKRSSTGKARRPRRPKVPATRPRRVRRNRFVRLRRAAGSSRGVSGIVCEVAAAVVYLYIGWLWLLLLLLLLGLLLFAWALIDAPSRSDIL